MPNYNGPAIEWSEEYTNAVQALLALKKKEGYRQVECVFAEVSHKIRMEEFKRIYDPGEVRFNICVHRLGKSSRARAHICNDQIPGRDRLCGFKKDGNIVAIVSQPYSVSYETLKETVEYCEKNGLKARISAEDSWHFPSSTVAIVYEKK